MSIENGSREDAHYQEIANDIKEKDITLYLQGQL